MLSRLYMLLRRPYALLSLRQMLLNVRYMRPSRGVASPNKCHPERSEGPAVDSSHRIPTSILWLPAILAFSFCPVRPATLVRASDVRASTSATPTHSNPDAACARCHQAIYTSYERTAMARGSGAVLGMALANTDPPATLELGSFDHQPSGIRYTVAAPNGRATLSFTRTPKTEDPARTLSGERQLRYWIGSGLHGRTYLYQVDGAWFELPINYYSQRHTWDMAPNFDRRTSMPADLPTDPGCLHCHATNIATPAPGTRSRYPGAPFAQGGLGCSVCHGDASAHLAAAGHAPIVNPGKLDAARRDSACLSCHLEGDVVVYRPGRTLAGFQPGEDLTETALYFVRAGSAGGGGRAASQYEALLRSACKRASGDRLTCTTCHDPHSTPTLEDRVGYYRGKCLTCHGSPTIAQDHHPEQPDCAHCHMPARSTTDISHEQAVDHDIERAPTAGSANAPRTGEALIAVGGWKASDRELGLAYAQMAERGDRTAGERALTLLARAEAAGASDPTLHARLGFLRQISGDRAAARDQYLAALKQDPDEPSALANLAVLDATSSQPRAALVLLHRLVDRDPSQTQAGLNLAFIECRLNDREAAAATLASLARYNPDDPALGAFRATGNYAGQHCDLRPHEAARVSPQ